ncbi:MAG: BadF/BadG/BcrA/BcrD ATPase family protein [Capsulimonadales bacterium]|nr:BadF/BadG/BcrA/BcrD ATPase family protein [Capsulimonadales bacterium]
MLSQNPRLLLGIDAGGTSVRLEVSTEGDPGTVDGRETAAAPDGGPEPLESLLKDPVAGDLTADSVAAVCAGITKFTRPQIADRWETFLRQRFPRAVRTVVPDYVIAFHGALPEGTGITVIAGTGAVVYGEDPHGGKVRVGGRGWEFGDEGSGAHMTADAVRRALRALDGVEAMTPMALAVCEFLGTTDAAALAERARQRAVTDGRGFLTPFLLELARRGDVDAENLFVGAGGWLAAWTRAAYRQLDFGSTATVRVATAGGLWAAGDRILLPFRHVIGRWVPNVSVVAPESPPTRGALRMAARLRGD